MAKAKTKAPAQVQVQELNPTTIPIRAYPNRTKAKAIQGKDSFDPFTFVFVEAEAVFSWLDGLTSATF